MSTLYPDHNTPDYQQAVTTLIGSNTEWEAMYDRFREKRTMEYLASSVTDRYAGMDKQPLWEDSDELYPVRYDIYGLSSLGRLALFTAAFLSGQEHATSFFDGAKVQDIYDRDCVIRTLVCTSLECKQGLGMAGLTRLWQSPTASTTTATLSMDVLTVGITNFIQQTSSIFGIWLDSMLKSQLSLSTNVCVALHERIIDRKGNDDDRLIKFLHDCLKPHPHMDAYYASFIELLMDHLMVHGQWTRSDLEKWLPLLKAEEERGNYELNGAGGGDITEMLTHLHFYSSCSHKVRSSDILQAYSRGNCRLSIPPKRLRQQAIWCARIASL